MIESRLSDILDGVSVLVVLLLILVGLAWFYGHRILKTLRAIDEKLTNRDDN